MSNQPTVYVELLDNAAAIRMVWERYVNSSDVSNAFKAINEILNQSESPLYVVVDIRNDPQFPLSSTLNGALFGPHRHAKLKGWLVLGTNPMARVIEKVLSSVTGIHNIQWFKQPEDVFAYLEQTAG